ncbi:MAG: hypothetical protein SVJ22_04390 [Halobacteriota archaeon]|nr:hypothetical protein [Halobacteriota archaeon]
MNLLQKRILSASLVVLMMISIVGTAAAEPYFAARQNVRLEGCSERPGLLGNETEVVERIVGDGILYAEGRGRALLEGTGWVSLRGVGQMIVVGEDVTVYTDGQGKVTHIGELITIYQGRGIARIEGEDIVVMVRGRGELAASGEGMAILRGTNDFAPDNWITWTENTRPYEIEGIELKIVE